MTPRTRHWIAVLGWLASPLLLLVPHYLFWFGSWFMAGAIWYVAWFCLPEVWVDHKRKLAQDRMDDHRAMAAIFELEAKQKGKR